MSINMIRPTWVDLRYFGSDRFFPNDAFKAPFSGKMDCEEIVSFDCVLLNMYEIESLDAPLRSDTEQIVAVILRPDVEPVAYMEKRGFTFCGYDLVEESTLISAITDCAGGFTSVPYDKLTKFGLLPTYKDAVLTQLALVEENPYDFNAHAYCMICEIWRKLV